MSSTARDQAQLVPEQVHRPFEVRAAERASKRPTPGHAPHAELLLALGIAALVRGWHIWSADFPLNDGGLFYAMVRDIQAAHYHLPAYTSYNGGHIPFGYSPFAFYLTALLNSATGVSLITLFRLL